MADGGGGKGKAVAGCSCLSMVFFLLIIILTQVGWTFIAQAMPDLATYGAIVAGPVSWVADGCCCLSGVGVIIGIVMLLMGGKKEEAYD